MSCGIDDIEDILNDENNNKNKENHQIDEIDRISLVNKSYIVPKNFKKLKNEELDQLNADSIIPGCAKIYVKT